MSVDEVNFRGTDHAPEATRYVQLLGTAPVEEANLKLCPFVSLKPGIIDIDDPMAQPDEIGCGVKAAENLVLILKDETSLIFEPVKKFSRSEIFGQELWRDRRIFAQPGDSLVDFLLIVGQPLAVDLIGGRKGKDLPNAGLRIPGSIRAGEGRVCPGNGLITLKLFVEQVIFALVDPRLGPVLTIGDALRNHDAG